VRAEVAGATWTARVRSTWLERPEWDGLVILARQSSAPPEPLRGWILFCWATRPTGRTACEDPAQVMTPCMKGHMMSKTQTNDIDAAVTHIRQAIDTIKHLDGPSRDEVAVDGIAVVLQDVIRRIEALGDDEGE